MIGFRFYEEFNSQAVKRKQVSSGNIVAVLHENPVPGTNYVEAVAAVYDYADSPVASTAVSRGHLRSNLRRISETKAREIHPRLFAYLDHAMDDGLPMPPN